MATPRFEFDPRKDRHNRRKHGVGLAQAESLWRGRNVVVAAKTIEGELRQAIIGEMGGRLWVALFSMREEVIRLISFHRAGESWRRKYEKAQEIRKAP